MLIVFVSGYGCIGSRTTGYKADVNRPVGEPGRKTQIHEGDQPPPGQGTQASIVFVEGAWLLHEDKRDGAIASFKKVLALDSENHSGLHAEVYNNLGLIALKNKADRDAIVNFRRAIDIDHNELNYRVNILIAYNNDYVSRHDDQSLLDAIQEIDFFENRPPHESTDKDLLELLQRERNRTLVGLLKAGEKYFEVSDPERAISVWLAVLRLQPENQLAQSQLVFEYYKNGDRDKALEYYRKVSDENAKAILKDFHDKYLAE